MAEGRRRSVDLPISRTLVALRRVRSLRDPSTNSMSKFSALFDSPNWENDSVHGVSLRFGDTCQGLGLEDSVGMKKMDYSDQVDKISMNVGVLHNFRESNSMLAPNADSCIVGGTTPFGVIQEVEGSCTPASESISHNAVKASNERHCGTHMDEKLNLNSPTYSSDIEGVDSCTGPDTESVQDERKDYRVPKLITQYQNRINVYSGAGDLMSCVGSPRLLLSDTVSGGTSPSTSLVNRGDDMDCRHQGCGLSCIWSRTPRLRDSNCTSDREYEGTPLLSGEPSEAVSGRRKGSRKHSNEVILYSDSPRNLSQKFKPRFFHDLVGQDIVARSLLNGIANRKIASFYLFYGPRGTGKTSASKILAAALNCRSHEEQKPCGVCRECVLSISGNNRNVVLVDSVSINQRDRIKSLLKQAVSIPASSMFKIFLFDECELLREETWATIISSLDNLPRHVVFIMITADLEKLPRDAVSRSQAYHFPKIRDAEISKRLKKICVEEGLHFDEVALDFVATKSNGSLRDAEMMLDQLSLLGQRITVPLAYELLGIISDDELVELLDLALSADTSNTVRKAREMMRLRIDPMQLTSQLANLIMDALAGKCEGISESRKRFFGRYSSEADANRLGHALKILSDTEKQLRMSKNQTTWLTAALLQLSSVESSSLGPNDSRMLPAQRMGHLRDGDFCSTSSTEESLKYLITCGCDNNSEKSGASYCTGKLEGIWMRATELCQSKSLRKFLRKNGKLSSLCINQGVIITELEFRHSKHVSRAERSWKLIASSLQYTLGRNVEIRINLVPCVSVAKNAKPCFNLFSCSHRMQHKSHSSAGLGSFQSDSSDRTSEKAMIGEKSSGNYSSPLPHVAFDTRSTATIRDGEGNALSTGRSAGTEAVEKKIPNDLRGGADNCKDNGGEHVGKAISEEPESPPNCFLRAVRFRRKLSSSNTLQLISAPRDMNRNPLAIHGKTSYAICGRDSYSFSSNSIDCANCLSEIHCATKDSNMHWWKAPSSLIKLKHNRQRSNLARWVLPCAS